MAMYGNKTLIQETEVITCTKHCNWSIVILKYKNEMQFKQESEFKNRNEIYTADLLC